MSGAVIDGLLLAIGTGILAWLSRKPLRHPGSHGFYRFFAWEAILGLVVMNRVPWGDDPFSPHQMASWLLMLISIALVVAGRAALREGRASSEGRTDGSLYAWESTTTLVTQGIFAHIRHPMYSSLLALAWGAFLQAPTAAGAGLVLAATGFLILTARADERECLSYFGQPYADYMRRTARFVPRIL